MLSRHEGGGAGLPWGPGGGASPTAARPPPALGSSGADRGPVTLHVPECQRLITRHREVEANLNNRV